MKMYHITPENKWWDAKFNKYPALMKESFHWRCQCCKCGQCQTLWCILWWMIFQFAGKVALQHPAERCYNMGKKLWSKESAAWEERIHEALTSSRWCWSDPNRPAARLSHSGKDAWWQLEHGQQRQAEQGSYPALACVSRSCAAGESAVNAS